MDTPGTDSNVSNTDDPEPVGDTPYVPSAEPDPVPGPNPEPTVSVSRIDLSKVTSPSRGKLKAVWQKYAGDGCQFVYSKSKNFPKNKTTVKDVKYSNQKTFQGLSRGKTYYVRVRAYVETDSGKVTGTWSKVKKVKIKK